MFGAGSSFSNSFGDDMMNNFLASNRRVSPNKTKLSESDEKHLLLTMKQIKELEKELGETPSKTEVVKTTTSLAQNSAIKKRLDDQKRDDKLINLELYPETTEFQRPKTRAGDPTKTDITDPETRQMMDALEELDSEDLFTHYDPTARSSKSRRSQEKEKRPATTEAKGTTLTSVDDEIGEINLTVTRRGGRRQTERPTTSPGGLEKSPGPSETIRLPPTNPQIIKTKLDDDETSTNSKARVGQAAKTNELPPDFGNVITPVRSPPSQFELSKDTILNDLDRKSMGKSVKDGDSTKGRDRSANLPKKQEETFSPVKPILPQRLHSERQLSPSKRDFDADAAIKIEQNRAASPPAKDSYSASYLREMEENYRKRLQETELYYDQRFHTYKKILDDEKKKWEEVQTAQLELITKEREEFRNTLNERLQQERERLKEIFKLEMESKEKIHQYEIQKQKQVYEEQYQNLKKQFESQSHLLNLADEVRMSSAKINFLADKVENGKSVEDNTKNMKIEERERTLLDRERFLRHEKELLVAEKSRIDKDRQALDSKQSQMTSNLQKEREWIQAEYRRITAVQESINNLEKTKKMELEKLKKTLEEERGQFEKEKIQFKGELKQISNDLELQKQILGQEALHNQQLLEKEREIFQRKSDELDDLRRNLFSQQSEMARKAKLMSEAERELANEVKRNETVKMQIEIEKKANEKQRLEILEMARVAREESDFVQRLKQQIDVQKEYQGFRDSNGKENRSSNAMSRTSTPIMDSATPSPEKSDVFQLNKSMSQMRMDYKNYRQVSRTSSLADFSFSNTKVENLKPTHRRENSASARSSVASSNTGVAPKRLFALEPKNLINDYKKIEIEPRIKQEGVAENKFTTAKPFNLKSYMSQLSEFDKHAQENQDYMINEKDGLLKEKVNLEVDKVNKLKNTTDGLSQASSRATSSSKFKF